jgi:hypothetical protein
MASGGLLIYMSTLSPGSGGSSIMAGQQAGFTTADTDLSFLPLCNLSAGTALTYHHRCIEGDVTTSQSADLSQGKGFLAASIDGELTIQDADGLIAADIANGHINPIGWDVWVASIPAGGAWSDIIVLVQMKTVDLAIGEGVIRFIEKSPAYLGNNPMYGIRTVSQLDTDPLDPTNPTDPTYLKSSTASQFAGLAMGSIDVSIKSSSQIPVETLAYYKSTQLQSGDISSSANPPSYIIGVGFDECAPVVPDSVGNVTFGAGLMLKCRVSNPLATSGVDGTECTRLVDLLGTFIGAGYRIILSDGRWSMDTADSGYSGYINFTANHIEPLTGGFAFGANAIPKNTDRPFAFGAVWFNLCDADGSPLYPSSGINPSDVKIYAVKSSISVSAQQVIVEGFASGIRTLPAAFAQSYADGITSISPISATLSGFYLCQSVPVKLFVDVGAPGVHRYGASYWNKALTSWNVVGDPANVNTVPGASVADYALSIFGQGISDSGDATLSFQLWLDFQENTQSDFYCIDISYHFSVSSPSGSRGMVRSSYWPDTASRWYSGSAGFSKRVSAKTALKHPIWRQTVESTNLSELAASQAYLSCFMQSSDVGTISILFELSEMFVWAFKQASFADLYPVVYPFWTRKNCTALATDGAGTILAGGAGLGVASADGSIAWTPFDILPNANGVAAIRSAAYGASTWVMVGYRTPDGSTFTNCFWHSADGVNWTEGTFAASTGLAECVRYVGGYFVCLYGINGTWKHSADGITWTYHASIVSVDLNDVAYDGTKWHFAGNNGFVAWTASITSPSFTSYGAGTLAVTCVNVISGFGPIIDCVVVGHPGGTVSRCPLSSLSSGSWASYTLGGSAQITDIGKSGLGLMAVSTYGAWFSADGANWTATQFDHLSLNTNQAITNTTVGGSTNLWIIGADAQIATLGRNGSWIPWGTRTPSEGLANIAGRYFGGLDLLVYGGNLPSVNPVRWTEPAFVRSSQSWGIAFDPPTDSTNSGSGTHADAAARKIAEEWWAFAGEMPAATLDGSNDAIEEGFPEIALGNIEDVATIITVQYAPFGGNYLKSAYIQNVDVDRATAGKPDAFFFSGWDAPGVITYGLALWTACRNAYLKTQILRATTLTFDSIHDETTLGMVWANTDADLGQRIAWLCSRPRYLKMTVDGNDSQAALAQCGCRYKPNTAMLAARGMPALNSTGYGVVVQADHNYTQGTHVLDIAFPPT